MDHAPVAQRIEQQPSKLSATGSSPVGGTNKTTANERHSNLVPERSGRKWN